MHHYCIYYSLLIIINVIPAEIITLTKEKNITCVVTGDSAHSAVCLSPPIYSGFIKTSKNIDMWVIDDWTVINAPDSNQGLVTDKRWEDFSLLHKDIGHALKSQPLSFSICAFESFVIDVLAPDFSDERLFSFTPNKIHVRKENGACQWFHYQLVKNKTTVYLMSENRKLEQYELDFDPYWIYFKNPSKNETLWKLHDYDFRMATVPTKSSNQMSTVTVDFTDNLCLSLYVSVDEDCFLDISLENSDKTIIKTVGGSNEKNSFRKWQKITFQTDTPGMTNLSFFRGSKHQEDAEGYWAIDEITFCEKDSEIYHAVLEDEMPSDYVCEDLSASNEQQLANTFQNISSCDSPGFLGESCNISCETLLGPEYPYCENHTICHGSTCFCSWGYQGRFCNKTCDDGTWGLFCKNRCDPGCDECHLSTGKCLTSKSTIPAETVTLTSPEIFVSEEMTEEDLPVDIVMSANQIILSLPDFNRAEKLVYNMKYECTSKWCEDETVKDDTVTIDPANYTKTVTLKFDEFVPFTDYRVVVTANISNQIRKKEYEVGQDRKASQIVHNLSVFSRSSNTLWLKFSIKDQPDVDPASYKIWYYEENSKLPPKSIDSISPCDLWDNFFCARIENLNEKSSYLITVESTENQIRKLSPTLTGFPAEKAPGAFKDLKIAWSDGKFAVLRWNHSFITNGHLRRFVIVVKQIGTVDNNYEYIVEVPKPQKIYESKIAVNFNTPYVISVRAWNEYEGEESTIKAEFFLVHPEFQATSKVLIKTCSETCQYLIPKPTDLEHSEYEIRGISENYTREEVIGRLRTMQNTKEQNYMDWQRFKNVDSDENYLVVQAPDALDKNQKYSMFLIFQNEENSTSIVYLIATQEKSKRIGPPSILGVMMLPTVIGLGAVLSLTVFLLISIHLQRKKAKKSRAQAPTFEKSRLIFNSFEESITKVETRSFESYLKNALLNGQGILYNFRSLPKKTKRSLYALQNKNNNKNKDKINVPYDHNRVVLKNMKGMGTGDYINASYIDGFDRPKVYIATQGPKFCTLRDFWRMIWQEHVQTIVMVTNFMETKHRKCAEYFPQRLNAVFECGHMFIKLINEQVYEDHVTRTFEVSYERSTRTVQHFHLRWSPNDLIPLYPNCVVPLVKKIGKIREKSRSPIVVHCSSGSNRTGTLILCDLALQMAKTTKSVDFYNLIKNLRDQRPNMISSEKQYILAHLIFLECLMEHEDVFRKSFKENFNSSVLKDQLSYVMRLRWHDKIVQSWTPYQTYVQNHLFHPVDGYATPRKFFTTQAPTKDSLASFWSTVIQEMIQVVVLLNNHKKIWPYHEKDATVSLTVKEQNSVATTYCTYTKLLIVIDHVPSNKVLIERKVNVFRTNNDYGTFKMRTVHEFLNISDDINNDHCKKYPFLVVCNDGITTSGLFVTLDYVIEKCKNEIEVDICNGIRTVQRSGLPFINNVTQLEFIYAAVLEYLQKFDRYSCIL